MSASIVNLTSGNQSSAVRNRRDQDPSPALMADAERAACMADHLKAMRPWLDLSLFPTPPWATRALIKHVLPPDELRGTHIWEPAAGLGHMSDVLAEAQPDVVVETDVCDYSGIVPGAPASALVDFSDSAAIDKAMRMHPVLRRHAPDWIITNPPFPDALAFILNGLDVAQSGVAVLARTNLMEGKERYERLFRDRPPRIVAPFAGRVDMTVGGIDPATSTATSYAWFVWTAHAPQEPVRWIPFDAEQELTQPSDRRLVERRVPGWKPASHWRKARAEMTQVRP